MPPKGYRHLSLREEVYRRLEIFAKERGVSSMTDAIVLLLEYADIYSKIEYILRKEVAVSQNRVAEEMSQPSVVKTSDEELEEIEKILSAVPEDEVSKPRQPSERTFCKKKSELKKVENYIKFLQSSGVLIKWWEEPDRYCFTVRE